MAGEWGALRRINYRDMDVEELGSVYEGLLEQQPALRVAGERTEFDLGLSGERKTTGSYYTNPGLVRELIRSALEPAIDGAVAKGGTKEEKRHRLLDLKVCDPACGSGHFLLAAARRIGRAVAEVDAGDDEPSPAAERAAIREAIGHCIYGVDLNPLAVDLCKVALWLEGQNAGKPLQFLDHHIRHGNSLIGATAEAMENGIPDAAFDPVTGDAKIYAATIKKKNRDERKHKGQRPLEELGVHVVDVTREDSRSRYFASLDASDETLGEVAEKAKRFHNHQHTPDYLRRKLTADLWTAAFFWPLQVGEAPPPTDAVWRRLAADPQLVDYIDERTMEELQGRADSRTVRQALRLSRRHDFFHWELEFEDVFSRPDPGFDVILGNPPWEVIQPEEKKWFAGRDDQIAEAAGARRKALIEALPETNPTLHERWFRHVRDIQSTSKLVRKSGRFPLTGQGDLNTYSLFSEVAAQTVGTRGRAGIIVPTGIATDDSNKTFFSSVVNNRRLVSLFDFENREGLFPSVDSRYKFSLLTTGRPFRPDGSFDVAFFLTQPSQLADPEQVFTLTPEEIALLNPNTRTAPIFRSRRDAEITKQLYRAAPVLVREGAEEINPWGVTLRQGLFNMTSDSHLFRTRQELEASGHALGEDGRFRGPGGVLERLYEAKMIHQFDHRFATFDSVDGEAEARDSSFSEHQDPDFLVLPRYWVCKDEVDQRLSDVRNWQPVFRGITNATNERTAIFGLAPRAGFGNSSPVILSTTKDPRLWCGWLAGCSSITFDFAARQKTGGSNFNFFIVKQLPILPPETYSPALLDQIVPRVLELVYTAWDVAPFARDLGYEGEPFRWDEERRALLRAELDGIYAHLYGLNRDDFAYILEQFPIVKRKDVAAFGEYRTARLCLEAYDYFAKGAQMRLWEAVREIETRLSQLVVQRLHNAINAVPEHVQAGQEAERRKQGKPPRADTLADFLEAGYLTLLGKVIRANREQFADMFASNGQVEAHLSPLIGLRNTLAHTKEAQIADKVRRAGEAEVRWFAERLGLEVGLVTPPAS